MSGYHKKRQVCSIQRICVSDKRRVRKQKSKEYNVCTGWTQEWVYPEQLRTKARLDIREVVRGPFLSAKLLQTRPYINVPSFQAKETFNRARRGIPDAWREHLASRGYCGDTEARVLQKNSIPSYVRCLATDRLWNDLGLPFTQGIPDPWKTGFHRLGAAKRRRHVSRKRIVTRAASNYDADDEAETEYAAARSYRKSVKEYAGNGECCLGEGQGESNLLSKKEAIQTIEHASKNNGKNAHEKIARHKSLSSKISGKSKDIGPTEVKEIRREPVRSKRVTLKGKPSVPVRGRSPRKPFDHSDLKRTVRKNVQIDLIEQTKESSGTARTPGVTRCRCASQDHGHSDAPRFSACTNLLEKLDMSQRVLCKNCESMRREDDSNFVNTGSRPRSHKVIESGKIYKRTTLKVRGCLRTTKQRFESLNYRKPVGGRHAVADGDLTLVCCHCDCPYLRIAGSRASNCDRGTSGKTRRDRRTGPRERRRISKCTTTRKRRGNRADSENRRGTRVANKVCASNSDLG
ncbi:uncharacterized protein LOC116433934 [Nomia melanderi]|uniref:uncharacterized protein LOC116433934 n=1 Tax=Nomia melanderi TaxID=2448451 RepID=UPI003FCE6EFB